MPEAGSEAMIHDARLYGKMAVERRANDELSAIIYLPRYCRRALLCDTQDGNS
jgi:hypothetical protein